MKFKLSVLLLIASFSIHAQENLTLGQDLNEYLKQHPPLYKTIGTKLVDLPEGATDFYKFKQQTNDSDIKILMILDKYLVGVLQSEKGKSKLYYDLSGDGIIVNGNTLLGSS